MNTTKKMIAFAASVWLAIAVASGGEKVLLRRIRVTKYASHITSFPGCTHIAFDGKTEIVTDTGNHRLITFRDPAIRESKISVTSLANIQLDRPHDIVHDSSTGWLYALNPDSSQIFRFQTAGKSAALLDLSRHLGYTRALTVVDGRLYVIGSSVRAVVEIIVTVHAIVGREENRRTHSGEVRRGCTLRWEWVDVFQELKIGGQQGSRFQRFRSRLVRSPADELAATTGNKHLIQVSTKSAKETGHWSNSLKGCTGKR